MDGPTNDKEVNEAIGEDYDELSEEGIDQEFSDLIRELTDEDFWKWVATWKDAESIIEDAEGWTATMKQEEIEKIRELIHHG